MRAGGVSLKRAYARIPRRRGVACSEMHIPPYKQGSFSKCGARTAAQTVTT